MNPTTIFSVLALDLQGSQEWDLWMENCNGLAAGIRSLLEPLKLKSEVILTQIFDERSKRFGIAAALGPGKQRNFLAPLESSIGEHLNHRELEACAAMDHVRSCLALVNQSSLCPTQGTGGTPSASVGRHGIEMNVRELTKICAQLAPKDDLARIRGSRGEVWTANVRARHLRLASDAPMTLIALPTKVGNSCADFRIESLRASNLKARNPTILGTWGPLFNPDWSDDLYSAMKRKQWLELTCAAVLHPSGFVKELQLYGIEECALEKRVSESGGRSLK